MDIFLSLLFLAILSPLFVLISLVLLFANKGKIFFIQSRPGKNGRPFRLIKFKTMNDRKDPEDKLLPDKARLTPWGAWIRKTSLDELPQLFNVLSGEMSLIGPRPLLAHYLPLYDKAQNRRHEVKPGITGWAQVHGRNNLPWKARFSYDLYYVDHLSLWLDLRILFLSVIHVLAAHDINQHGEVTVRPFTGN